VIMVDYIIKKFVCKTVNIECFVIAVSVLFACQRHVEKRNFMRPFSKIAGFNK